MVKEGIRERLEEYIIRNQERFYRLAYSHVGTREGALDVVQNAVVKGLEGCGAIRRSEYMETWFFRVLINECHGYGRKAGREISYEPEALQQMREEQGNADDGLGSLGIYEDVMKLPDKMKTVIILRFYEEFTLGEIARITGTGLSTVKYRLYTGLKQLKKLYEEESI